VVEKGIKVKAYEKQGILENADSDYCDSVDGTDHHTGRIEL